MKKDFQPLKNLLTGATAHLQTQTQNLQYGVHRQEIATKTTPPESKKPKWLTKHGKHFALPDYARFRMVIDYVTGKRSKYPSLDFFNRFENGVKYIVQSEETGFSKLLKSKVVQKTPYENYFRITIYVNLTNDLRRESHNYNHKVLEIEKGIITARYMVLRYMPDGKLDVQKTLLDTEQGRAMGILKKPFVKQYFT